MLYTIKKMTVSVIIPIYNAEMYLSKCIESILAQSMPDFELLLVDDGSTDGSGALCDRYAEQDERIRVFHRTNGGVSRARNCGLDEAQGDYIVFIDADDWVDSDHLEQFLRSGIAADGIAFSNFYRERPDGRPGKPAPMPDFEVTDNHEHCMKAFAQLLRARCFGWSWNKMFCRETIERHGLRFDPNIQYAEDEIFTARYCTHVRRIVCNSHPTYHYRYVQNSLLHKPKDPLTILQNWQYIRRQYADLGYYDEVLYITVRTLFSRVRRELRSHKSWNSEVSNTLAQGILDNWKYYRRYSQTRFRKGFYDMKVLCIGWLACAPNSKFWTKLVIKGLHL